MAIMAIGTIGISSLVCGMVLAVAAAVGAGVGSSGGNQTCSKTLVPSSFWPFAALSYSSLVRVV